MTGASTVSHPREPDRDLLCGHAGPYAKNQTDTKPAFQFDQVHPDLQEMLIRLDRDEVLAFNKGVKIITSLDPKALENFKLAMKVFGGFLIVGRAIKWAVGSFFAGLAAVSLAGDQIQKVLGQLRKGIAIITSMIGLG